MFMYKIVLKLTRVIQCVYSRTPVQNYRNITLNKMQFISYIYVFFKTHFILKHRFCNFYIPAVSKHKGAAVATVSSRGAFSCTK